MVLGPAWSAVWEPAGRSGAERGLAGPHSRPSLLGASGTQTLNSQARQHPGRWALLPPLFPSLSPHELSREVSEVGAPARQMREPPPSPWNWK